MMRKEAGREKRERDEREGGGKRKELSERKEKGERRGGGKKKVERR